jgi:FkbM family methyltransferase
MSLIFDIGFNKGEFTTACNNKFPNHNVVGVEANTGLYYNTNTDKFKNLTLINYLVSDMDKSMGELYIDPNQSGISSASKEFINNSRFAKGSKYLSPNNSNWSTVIKVPTITLDTMIESFGQPEIIKVDVEGYEYEVFSGLTVKSGKICFECHEEEIQKLHNIIEHLLGLGYNQFGLIGYFDEGDIYENLTYSSDGDPYLVEPNKYMSWELLSVELQKCFQDNRRVNYGMIWCK